MCNFSIAFILEIRRYYDAEVSNVNFAGNNSGAVSGINKWVSDKTNGKIDKLLDGLDNATVMVLLNAVFFKGAWKTTFPKRMTAPRKFNNYDSNPTEVPTMHVTDSFPHRTWQDCQVLGLPYKGGDFSMLVFLPDQGKTLEDVRSSLTAESIQKIMDSMEEKRVKVALPKFKLSYSKEFSKPMRSLGAGVPFTAKADFSGVSGSANIRVSQAIHKAEVDVDEEGSEAAAATVVERVGKSDVIDFVPPLSFVVDRPFLFAIVSKACGSSCYMLVFVGSVLRL